MEGAELNLDDLKRRVATQETVAKAIHFADVIIRKVKEFLARLD